MKIQQRRIFLMRVKQDESIPMLSFHSLDDGETLAPIVNLETIGSKPSNFSKDRSFWTYNRIGSIKTRY